MEQNLAVPSATDCHICENCGQSVPVDDFEKHCKLHEEIIDDLRRTKK